MCAMYCVLAIVTCGYNQTTLFTTASYCRLDPSWATVTRCEWGSSVFTVVYTEGAMAIIIRVALPSSFRAASYHGGSSQLLILLVSAVRGAVPLQRRRSGAVSYLQLLHAARRRWANLLAATYWRGFRDVSLSSGSQWAIPGGSRGQWPRFSDGLGLHYDRVHVIPLVDRRGPRL